MDAKEKAIAACAYCPIATHINYEFNIGWYTNQLYEVCVCSEVNEDGLFLWANNGYGDTKYPCWGWENKPYFEGLLHAFHQELAAILVEFVPVEKITYTNLEEEFQAINDLLPRVTIIRGLELQLLPRSAIHLRVIWLRIITILWQPWILMVLL